MTSLIVGVVALLAAEAVGPTIMERIDYTPLDSPWRYLPYAGEATAREARIFYKLVVSPDGAVDACGILLSNGNTDFDEKLCGFLKRKYLFRPARDSLGHSTYGVSEAPLSLIFTDRESSILTTGPDYRMDVLTLPKNAPDPPEVWVAVEVGLKGGFVACAIPDLRMDKKRKASVNALAAAACAQLPKIWDPMPEKDKGGTPISYVRKIRVEFQVAQP